MQLFIIAAAVQSAFSATRLYFGCSQIGSDGRIRSLTASSRHRDLGEGAGDCTRPSAVVCSEMPKPKAQEIFTELNKTSCSDEHKRHRLSLAANFPGPHGGKLQGRAFMRPSQRPMGSIFRDVETL